MTSTLPTFVATSRRGFILSTLSAGFALAVQPIMAQTVVNTHTTGLNAGFVEVNVQDGSIPAYYAAPAGKGSLPIILVVQEIFGVHAHIQDVCRRLAQLGYLAVAPELYARQGNPAELTQIDEILKIVATVPDQQVLTDLDATVAWAVAHHGDIERLGITGFCWGGRITWLYAAHQTKLKAAVAWYGRLSGDINTNTPTQPLQIAEQLKAPVLGLYGGQDAGIPLTDVTKMQNQLKNGSDIHVYPDAPHAFYADYRPSYRKAAADDAWQRLQVWFKQHGVK
jgi:carboxymethylenebutenolidase